MLRQAILKAMADARLDALAYPTIRRKATVVGQVQPGTNCHLSRQLRPARHRRSRRFHAGRPAGRGRAAGASVERAAADQARVRVRAGDASPAAAGQHAGAGATVRTAARRGREPRGKCRRYFPGLHCMCGPCSTRPPDGGTDRYSRRPPDERRLANFEAYWAYSLDHDGAILQNERDLVKKRDALADFRAHPVRSRRPLADPLSFHRNHVVMRDDPLTLDRKTLLLTFLYKFARHEYVGISAAWARTRPMTDATSILARIGLYHLCEEFSHMRLFQEIFRTFHLGDVQWVPLGKWMSRMYRIFPLFPEALLAPPAFVSELMGLTVVPAHRPCPGRRPGRRARGPRACPHPPAGGHDRRAGARRPAPQLPRPPRATRGSPDAGANVSCLLPRHSGDDAALRRRADGARRQRVRLQHDRAGHAREELGAVLLPAA